jgi:DnaJ-class molecular chaperone
VKIKEKKHRYFKRKGNDLIYTQRVTLADALNGKTIQLETLDGRNLYVSMDEVIT